MHTPYKQLRSPRVVRSVTDKVLQMHSHTMSPLIRGMLHVKALLR